MSYNPNMSSQMSQQMYLMKQPSNNGQSILNNSNQLGIPNMDNQMRQSGNNLQQYPQYHSSIQLPQNQINITQQQLQQQQQQQQPQQQQQQTSIDSQSMISMQSRKKRSRRNEKNNRDFTCGCGKRYLSYPALYTHLKQKHEGKPPQGTIQHLTDKKGTRGRPRKDEQNKEKELTQTNDSDITEDDGYNSLDNYIFYLQEVTQNILNEPENSKIGTDKNFSLIVENTNETPAHPYNDFPKEIFISSDDYQIVLSYIEQINKMDGQFDEEFINIPKFRVIKNTNCNLIFAKYLYRISKHIKEAAYKEIVFLIMMYRKAMNQYGADLTIQDQEIQKTNKKQIMNQFNMNININNNSSIYEEEDDENEDNIEDDFIQSGFNSKDQKEGKNLIYQMDDINNTVINDISYADEDDDDDDLKQKFKLENFDSLKNFQKNSLKQNDSCSLDKQEEKVQKGKKKNEGLGKSEFASSNINSDSNLNNSNQVDNNESFDTYENFYTKHQDQDQQLNNYNKNNQNNAQIFNQNSNSVQFAPQQNFNSKKFVVIDMDSNEYCQRNNGAKLPYLLDKFINLFQHEYLNEYAQYISDFKIFGHKQYQYQTAQDSIQHFANWLHESQYTY